jgi:hypothetical protein
MATEQQYWMVLAEKKDPEVTVYREKSMGPPSGFAGAPVNFAGSPVGMYHDLLDISILMVFTTKENAERYKNSELPGKPNDNLVVAEVKPQALMEMARISGDKLYVEVDIDEQTPVPMSLESMTSIREFAAAL